MTERKIPLVFNVPIPEKAKEAALDYLDRYPWIPAYALLRCFAAKWQTKQIDTED